MNDIKYHVEEVRKRRTQTNLGDKEFILSDLDTRKNEIIKEVKNIEFVDLDDMAYRMELTYDKFLDLLDVKNIPAATVGYTMPPGIDEITNNISQLKSLLPNDVKADITINDIRLKSNLSTIITIGFTKKTLFYIKLGFKQSQSEPLGDINGVIQFISGTHRSDKPNNTTGINEIHSKGDCIQRSIVNGIREPNLFSFAPEQPSGHKIYNERSVKLLKKRNKSVLSHIIFYLEDDDQKTVVFSEETLGFTCQLIKI